MRGALVVVLALLTHAATLPAGWQGATPAKAAAERIAGLLNIPDVIGDGCSPEGTASVALYDKPSSDASSIGVITLRVEQRQGAGNCAIMQIVVRRSASGSVQPLPTQESGYEIPAAIVYQKSGSWFRIALQGGTAWLKRDRDSDFQSYPELLPDKLGYLRPRWDGRLWHTAGSGAAIRIPSQWKQHLGEEIPIEFLGVRRVGGDTWMHIRVTTERCGRTLAGVEAMTGWIPAYRESGQTSAWFYSRGC